MIALFVPADRPDRFTKAALAADLAILDLEDAVALNCKPLAREAVAAALRDGSRAWIRINPIGTPEALADLAMLAANPAPVAVMTAKTADAGDVEVVRRHLPATPVIALIESIAGIVQLDEIAAADGVDGIALGGYDLCAEMGARVCAEILAPWRARLVFAACRFGRISLDTPFADISDLTGLADDARRAADFGFTGKLAIHPGQVATIRTAFAPTAYELQRARDIVAHASDGVTLVDGTMIDAPLLALARLTLERADPKET
jgi:citrate lyase beta subunit